MAHDVFQIFRDLEHQAVGADDNGKMPDGYFTSFRGIGLPIFEEDYKDPMTPFGAPKTTADAAPEATDPKDSQQATGSAKIAEQRAIGETSRQISAFVNTFLLVDDKLVLDHRYRAQPGSAKVSDTWYSIIRGAQVLPSNTQLKPQFQAEVEKQEVLLNKYKTVYDDYADKYEVLQTARYRARAVAMESAAKLAQWPTGEGALYMKKFKRLNDDWIALGKKYEYEKALAYLKAQGVDPLSLVISRARDRFEVSKIAIDGIGELPYVMISPSSWCRKDVVDGWNEYKKYDWSQSYHYDGSSTSYSASGGGGSWLGLWSAGASFSGNDREEHSTSELKNLRIKFNYCIADVRRPWMDTSLLSAGGWFLVGDYAKGFVSKGSMNQEWPSEADYAFLPSIVTSLILVRDVEISWDNWKTEWSSHVQNSSGSASAGFWCFTARANYSHRSEKRDFTFDATGESLKIFGTQLVGYVSAINPLAPKLDGSGYLEKTANP